MPARVRTAIGVVLAVLCAWVLMYPCVRHNAYAAGSTVRYDSQSVTTDLAGMTINGRSWSALDYPAVAGADPQLLTLTEYCYAAERSHRGNYGLYLYIYNPGQLSLLLTRGHVMLATAYDADGNAMDYAEHDILGLSISADKIWVKYKVADVAAIGDRVTPAQRRYDVSGVELATGTGVYDYDIGRTYLYSGYAAGYGPADQPLTSMSQDLLTVRVQTHDTVYRPDMDNPDLTDRNQITSVWFSVPDDVLDRYGSLQRIKAEWWEYRTQPIIVTSDQTIYDSLTPWIGIDTGPAIATDYGTVYAHNDAIPYMLTSNVQYLGGNMDHGMGCEWSYNIDNWPGESYSFPGSQQRLRWIFSTGGADLDRYVVSSERLFDFASGYPVRDKLLPGWGTDMPADLFTDDVGRGRTAGHNVVEYDAADRIDLLHYDPNPGNMGAWNYFLSLFGGYQSSGSTDLPAYSPIVPVTLGDFAATDGQSAEQLLVAEADVPELRQYVKECAGKEQPETVFLFRFALSNSRTERVWRIENTWLGGAKMTRADAVLASQNVFGGMDLWTLTFRAGESVSTTLPVICTPLDIMPDVEIPVQPHTDIPWWVWLIIGIVALVLIGFLCMIFRPLWGVVKWIGKLLWWVISAPMRGIAWIVKKLKGD